MAPRKPLNPDFETIYVEYYDRVYRYAYTILLNREDAEDVVEETFLAAYAAYGRYDPSLASPATWLTRIAHNMAVNLMKSAAYRKRAEEPEEPERTGADFTQRVEDSDTTLRLYAHLTPAEREFLDLRYVMEMKDAEIGAMLGIPAKTVNKRYQRLLERCRMMLDSGQQR